MKKELAFDYSTDRRYKKAFNTARNIPNTPESKESLIVLLTFSSSLYKKTNQNKIKQIANLAREWEIPYTEGDIIKKCREINKSKDLSYILMVLVDMLSSARFFDIQRIELSNFFNTYAKEYRVNNPGFTSKENRTIELTNKDFYMQFNNEAREMQDYDKYANVLYLVNQLSHIVKYLPEQSDTFLSKRKAHFITQELRNIKSWCIHEIIEQKRLGNPVEISIIEDKKATGKNNSVISFTLPNYFEPFGVHINKKTLSPEELALCDGKDRFFNAKLKTIFPQYISPEKMQLLQKVHKQYNQNNIKNSYSKRLKWMFDTRRILDSKNKTNTTREKPSSLRKEDPNSLHAWIPSVMDEQISPSTHPEIAIEIIELNNLLRDIDILDKRKKVALEELDFLGQQIIKKLQIKYGKETKYGDGSKEKSER